MDGGAWWAAIHGVTQSGTRLKRLSSSSNYSYHRHYGIIKLENIKIRIYYRSWKYLGEEIVDRWSGRVLAVLLYITCDFRYLVKNSDRNIGSLLYYLELVIFSGSIKSTNITMWNWIGNESVHKLSAHLLIHEIKFKHNRVIKA